jgi:hypothetical protein
VTAHVLATMTRFNRIQRIARIDSSAVTELLSRRTCQT